MRYQLRYVRLVVREQQYPICGVVFTGGCASGCRRNALGRLAYSLGWVAINVIHVYPP